MNALRKWHYLGRSWTPDLTLCSGCLSFRRQHSLPLLWLDLMPHLHSLCRVRLQLLMFCLLWNLPGCLLMSSAACHCSLLTLEHPRWKNLESLAGFLIGEFPLRVCQTVQRQWTCVRISHQYHHFFTNKNSVSTNPTFQYLYSYIYNRDKICPL